MDPYKITFESWNKVAQLYQDKFMQLDLYDDTYDTFCRLIENTNARVFEVGCGPGNITKYLLSKRPDLNIEAIDIAPNMLTLARKNNPTADFKVMDCRDIHMLAKHFDAIICGFCMPYLSNDDCAKLIADCSLLLNSNGVFYFSAIEGDYTGSGYETGSSGDKTYVYYHEAGYLQNALINNNFEVIELVRKNYGANATHIIFIARKK